tara:strand:- start:317 stop:1867 length:1551 start_codon:yes stop_codon:yes gene_type:complete
MVYKIAIPSKNRINILKKCALEFIKIRNLKANVYIFVNNDDYNKYCEEFKNTNYNIVLGKDGLINQRNYMRDYFNENDKILYLDDDFINVCYEGNKNLNTIIEEDFKKMKDNNIILGSVNPTNNSWFKSNVKKIGLYLCVGCYYYEINKKDCNLYLNNQFESEKEDYIRTILSYNYCGNVLRNDKLNVCHIYNRNDGGGMTGNRKFNNNMACDYINNKYKNITSIFYKKEGENKEIKYKINKHIFKKLYLDVVFDSELGKYYNIDDEYINLDINKNYMLYDKNKNLIAVVVRNVIIQKHFNYDLLNKITHHGTNNRSNISGEIDINKLDFSDEKKKKINKDDLIYINKEKTRAYLKGTKYQFCNKFKSNNIGYFKLRKDIKETIQTKLYGKEFYNNFKTLIKQIDNWSYNFYPNQYKPIKTIYNTQYSGVVINNNTRAANHYDNNNKGWCSMVTLGNFKGCELLFPDYKLNLNLQSNKDILLFDSKNIKHCNNNYKGNNNNRYSLVFFKNNRLFKK